MSARNILVVAGLLILTCIAVPPARAEDGRIPIFEPTVITAPGSYVLTRDVSAPGGQLIDIQASAQNVDLDLNGFSLNNTSGGPVLIATGLDRLRLYNGTMQRPIGTGYGGIGVYEVKQLIVESITFNTAHLIGQNVDQFLIRGNDWPLTGGIQLTETNTNVRRTGTIENNEITGGAIVVNGTAGNRLLSVAVKNNRVTAGQLYLLYHAGCVIADNRVSDSADVGVVLDQARGCLISNNAVQDTASHGFRMLGTIENKMLNNVVTQSGGCGVVLLGAAHVHLERNVFSKNFECGIAIDSNSNNITLSGNIARGNAAIPAGFACTNPAITYCPAPYGTGFSAPNYCNDGSASTMCDNMMPGPPRH